MEESKETKRELRPSVRMAFVIGNSAYREVDGEKRFTDLPHCENDAKRVAELLEKKLGF